MTCREKLAMEHPEGIDPECVGGCSVCPHTYGYAKDPEWCKPGDETCTKCWDREVEEVETDVKTDVKTDEDSSAKSSGEMTVFLKAAQ